MADEERLRFPHGHRPRLRVKEQDGDPTVEGVREIRVTNATLTDEGKGVVSIAIGVGGGGAPTDADYLVGTANPGLSAEIVVGTTPGGELGGTWASPTVDAMHSGSAHHDTLTLAAAAEVLFGLTGQSLDLDTQAANTVVAGPASGAAAKPTARALVDADIPDVSATYVPKSLYDAQSVLAATADNTPAAVTVAQQTVVGRLTGGNIDDIAIGIADDNIVQVDQYDAADNDYAKFTAAGIEGRSYAEVKSDLDLEAGTDFPSQTTFDDHNARHEPGGADPMAVDAAAATGSLRTLGTGATAACAGNDARLSDARAPTAHNIFSTSHGDIVAAAAPVDGDMIQGNATPKWAKVAISIPGAANLLNVMGIVTGELRSSWKALFDATVPSAVGVASAGTGVVAARVTHVHSNTVILSWLFSGNCTVKTHEKKFKLPFATDFSDIKLLVLDGNEPTGDELIVDIQFCTDDATWDTTFSTLPEIDIAAQEDDGNHAQAHTAYAANTYFICKCTQIGSTNPGVGLGVDLILTR